VEDSLGLSSSTIETLVELSVQNQIQPWWAELFSQNGTTVLAALFLTATVLILLILFAGRRNIFASLRHRLPGKSDPLTQAVRTVGERKRSLASATSSVPTIPRDQAVISAPAQLVSQTENGNPLPGRVISLNNSELTLGNDPKQSMCVLDSPCIDPVHARIVKESDGCYRLTDQGTIAGTWRNYDPVPPDGVLLEHGDVVHFGTMAFRFEMRQPARVFVAKIDLLNDDKS
jgi:pSer/pThr/pTyr-binding forkhead associated (FHA) protein